MRYIGAISDTDILINLAKANRLDILEKLFEKIVIPYYIYEVELKKNAGRQYSAIIQAINKESSIFEVIDRKKDKAINSLSKDIIKDKRGVIGPGESECAGYAQALRIPIIISDNYTEFKWLDEFITLTHRNLLALCVYFGHVKSSEAEEIFNSINSQLTRPTRNTFNDYYKKSIRDFKNKNWNKYLGIK